MTVQTLKLKITTQKMSTIILFPFERFVEMHYKFLHYNLGDIRSNFNFEPTVIINLKIIQIKF